MKTLEIHKSQDPRNWAYWLGKYIRVPQSLFEDWIRENNATPAPDKWLTAKDVSSIRINYKGNMYDHGMVEIQILGCEFGDDTIESSYLYVKFKNNQFEIPCGIQLYDENFMGIVILPPVIRAQVIGFLDETRGREVIYLDNTELPENREVRVLSVTSGIDVKISGMGVDDAIDLLREAITKLRDGKTQN